MGIRSLALLATAAAAACTPSSPEVPDPGAGDTLPQTYADVLLNFTVGGQFGVCRKQLPDCEVPLDTPCDDAGATPEALAVLGAPDATSFTFGMDGRLDVGIHCGAITEAGPLIIHATAPAGTQGKVFVSLEGIEFTYIGNIEGEGSEIDAGVPATDAGAGDAGAGGAGNYEFVLTRFEIHSIRYVRVFDTGGGGLAINAIEGTWSGGPQ
jgi:hypothetical protein